MAWERVFQGFYRLSHNYETDSDPRFNDAQSAMAAAQDKCPFTLEWKEVENPDSPEHPIWEGLHPKVRSHKESCEAAIASGMDPLEAYSIAEDMELNRYLGNDAVFEKYIVSPIIETEWIKGNDEYLSENGHFYVKQVNDGFGVYWSDCSYSDYVQKYYKNREKAIIAAEKRDVDLIKRRQKDKIYNLEIRRKKVRLNNSGWRFVLENYYRAIHKLKAFSGVAFGSFFAALGISTIPTAIYAAFKMLLSHKDSLPDVLSAFIIAVHSLLQSVLAYLFPSMVSLPSTLSVFVVLTLIIGSIILIVITASEVRLRFTEPFYLGFFRPWDQKKEISSTIRAERGRFKNKTDEPD